VYGADPDWNLVIQALARGEERSSERTREIMGGLADFRGTFERVAIARTDKEARIGVAQALAPKSTHIETRSATVGPARIGGAVDGPVRAAVKLAAAGKCIECHADQGKQVKAFDITKYDVLTADAAQRNKVFAYVAPGGKPHCPPGKQLSQAEINELTIAPEPMPAAKP
jgi:cytochrome c553